MSTFKMVENRKYNQEEIEFVVSRVHARWDPTIIAKAFKKQFGEYWVEREFTKKQVAYIRSTYKPPPGMVKTYNGPIPEFSRSPTPEESPPAASSSTAGRKRKQANVRYGHNRSSSNQTSVNPTPRPGSPVAGPSRKRQRTQAPRDTLNAPPQGGSGSGSGSVSGPDPDLASALGLLRGMNDAGGGDIMQPGLPSPNHDDFDDNNYDAFEDEDPALRNASLEPSSPGAFLPGGGGADFDLDLAAAEQRHGDPAPALPNYLDLHPNIPVQSIERHRSIAPASMSGFPTPQQQQQHPQPPAHHPNLHGGGGLIWPHPYSHRGAVARDDPHGVWYFNPHDNCQIPLGHRHDFCGGVWFTSGASASMSLMAMRATEGVGFLLGVATAAQQILLTTTAQHGRPWLLDDHDHDHDDGGGGGGDLGVLDPHDLMTQAAALVRDHVPPEVLDGDAFAAPDPADVARLAETNRRLPAGNFWDPFHRRVVEYDMSGRGGGGGGGGQQQQGDGDGDGAPGPSSRQRGGLGLGGGAAAAAGGGGGGRRPSRQGTVAPRTPRGPRASRQGTGAPGASGS